MKAKPLISIKNYSWNFLMKLISFYLSLPAADAEGDAPAAPEAEAWAQEKYKLLLII